jgi:hypothetical protein
MWPFAMESRRLFVSARRWTVPAQVGQDLLRALDGGFAVDHPPLGPDCLGAGQVRPFLTHQVQKEPAQERREDLDGHQRGGASWSPLGSGRRRPHPPGRGRAHGDGRPGYGARWAAHTRPR